MPNTIKIKSSTTSDAAPSSLVAGELAINRADGQIYYLNASSAIAAVGDVIDGGELRPSAGILLNLNGSNGSTTFTNGGALSAVTFSASGGATISTAQSKFGGASLSCAGGTQWITSTANAGLAHGTADFTLEFWLFNSSALSGSNYMFRTSSGTATGDGIIMGAGSTPGVYISSSSGSWNIISNGAMTGITTNTWQHIAITRNGSTFRGFVDGTQRWTATSSASIFQSANVFRIGAVNPTGTTGIDGYIDDFRYVSGFCAYTANFTPPAAQLTAAM